MDSNENGAIAPEFLNFIDRLEMKITSPGREMISPTKSSKQRSLFGENDKDPVSTVSDSGQDSSNKSSEGHLDEEAQTFVDRQERYTEAEETDKILSEKTTVERLFDFLEPEMQSLDFANNNNGFADDYDDENDVDNEFGPNEQLVELKITECVTGDVYLGKEVGKDGCDENNEQESKSFSSKSDSMNLYWYKDTPSLDLAELEAFKSSQAERVSTEITTSNLYYAAKNQQDIKESAENKYARDVIHQNRTAEDSNREKWSPAFESASSRILNLATELKSEPKAKRDESDATSQVVIVFEKQHPWGLESDEKLKYKRRADELEDLPDLEDVIISDVYGKNVGSADEALGLDGDRKVKSVVKMSHLKSFKDLENESNEDEEDAVGYIEMKDKPGVQEAVSASEVRNVEMVQAAKTGIEMEKAEEMSMSFCNNLDNRTVSPKSMQKFSSQQTVADVVESVEKQPVETSTSGHIQEPFVYDPFTVKRTYKSSVKSEEMLQGKNGVFVETETFVDEYLDDKCYSLILQDSWLRLRNKRFEMQVNASFGYGNNSTMDEILTNENDIKEMLMNMYSTELEQRRKVSDSHVDVLIDSLGLMEFVSIVTTRKRYQVGNCMVLLEVSDKGHMVGEIEIIVNSPRAIPKALDQMDALASEIGFQPLQGR
ncbi:uncharacterized protein LOC127846430 isoform X2 [Dreissena polymorpha]|uniref:CYTH domain-containing protein n=2 Tax=Dreissena polymorpha TaxID=45954 RepID=A0A9D4E7V0_DREPO|nr:uncharacterized protein LOC127846430 isoform X2 [Dreissena polymorpha]KAH3774358.1 hypothetical protein DPMN_175739 [Dreissena polymorpha]